jgi:hypothetical protein
MKQSSYIVTVNRILLLWLAVRAVNLFIHFIAEHSALHTEARLLVQHLCDTTHNRKISGALIDCAQARTLLNTKSFSVTWSLEKTLRTIVFDCWANATHGLASLVQLLGLITTLMFTSAICLQNMYLGAQRIRYARSEYGESWGETLGLRGSMPKALKGRAARAEEVFEEEPLRQKFD